jgi:fatty acid desaturase
MSPEAAAVLETLPEPRKRKRVAMWTLIVWTALMGVWIIGAGASDTGIGVSLLVGLWAFGLFCFMAVTVIVRLGRSNG